MRFSVQRKTVIRKYKVFVQGGVKRGPIWYQVIQIYLGDQGFIDSVQQHIGDKGRGLQIPKIQKRPVARSLQAYERTSNSRDEAIISAYASGAYSYQGLGDYFGLHFTRIGKIVRMSDGVQ